MKTLKEFKKEILAILKEKFNDLENTKIMKSLLDVAGDLLIQKGRAANIGEVREWKGQKFKKIAPNKWRPIYDSNTRGAKQSIKILAKKVANAKSENEVLQIVTENKDRFIDKNGKKLEIVEELKNAVRNQSVENGFSVKSNAVLPSNAQLDNLYFNLLEEAEKTKNYEAVQRLVDNAAEQAAVETFKPEETDNPCYKLRRGATPQHTIKVYKKASTVNGNFVTLFMGGATPIRLPIGVWLDAVPSDYIVDPYNGHKYVPVKMKQVWNPKTQKYDEKEMGSRQVEVSLEDKEKFEKMGFKVHYSEKGSENKAGKVGAGKYYFKCLAYRPGWHSGELPVFTQGGKVVKGTDIMANNPNDVYYECEIPDPQYGDWQQKADERSTKDLQEMPIDGSYKKITNANKKAVQGDWFISGTMKVVRPLTEQEVSKILKENGATPQGWSNGNDELGELDLARINVKVDETDAYKKLRDVVTYDDEGKIIPLSERFDKNSNDIRKSISFSSQIRNLNR